MVRQHNRHRALQVTSIPTGITILSTHSAALAHVGHDHSRSAEPAATEESADSAATETAEDGPNASEAHSMTESADEMSVEDSQPMPMDMADDVPAQDAVTEAQVVPENSTTRATISEGFSIGFGESMLGLIIAGPFLLASLKKQFQS